MAVVLLEEVSAIDPGVAQEIGTLRVRNDAMITRIGSATGSGGELVFLEDVPATFGTIRKTVRYRRQTGDDVVGGLAQWLRAEAQVVKPNASIQPGMQLVLASARRAGWATCAPFKSPDKKGEWERDNPLASPAAGLEEVIERLEGLSYDYWEKSDFLTAGVSTPAEPAFEDASNVSRTVWVLGACDDSLACQAALYASDRVRQLLAWTEQGSLRFWPTHTTIPEHYKTLHETTRQDANWLMLVSIRQALAGPDQDTSIWLGRPVTDLVEQIYKEHVYNRNRGLVEQDLKSAAFFATVRELHAHEERRCGRRTRRNHADD